MARNSDDGRTEPAAAHLEAARQMRGMYIALVRQGFTVDEALAIIGNILAAGVQAAIKAAEDQ